MYGTQDASHLRQLDYVNLICGELGGFRRSQHSVALSHNQNQHVRMAVHSDDFVCLSDDNGLKHIDGLPEHSAKVFFQCSRSSDPALISVLDIGAVSVLGQNWCRNTKPKGRWSIIATTMTDIFAASEHPVFAAESFLVSGQLEWFQPEHRFTSQSRTSTSRRLPS